MTAESTLSCVDLTTCWRTLRANARSSGFNWNSALRFSVARTLFASSFRSHCGLPGLGFPIETRGSYNSTNTNSTPLPESTAGVGMNTGVKDWLRFYVLQEDAHGTMSYMWSKCPWLIVEILQAPIKGRRRRMRERELVRAGDNQRPIGHLVQGNEDQEV